MIRNERQYRSTLHQRQMLAGPSTTSPAAAFPYLQARPDQAPGDRAAQIVELERASLVGQLAELDAQVRGIDDFERVSSPLLVCPPLATCPMPWCALASLPDCRSASSPSGWA